MPSTDLSRLVILDLHLYLDNRSVDLLSNHMCKRDSTHKRKRDAQNDDQWSRGVLSKRRHPGLTYAGGSVGITNTDYAYSLGRHSANNTNNGIDGKEHCHPVKVGLSEPLVHGLLMLGGSELTHLLLASSLDLTLLLNPGDRQS